MIGFDVQFTEPTDPADDDALIEAVGHAGGVVLSTIEVGPHGSTAVLGGNEELRQLDDRRWHRPAGRSVGSDRGLGPTPVSDRIGALSHRDRSA